MQGKVAVLVACLGLLLAGCQPFRNTDTGSPSADNSARPQLSAELALILGGSELVGTPDNPSALTPKDPPYNAKGDGVADDTDALQAWLTAGGVRLANGTFRIVKGLTLAGHGRQLYTDNAKLLADGTNITALTATGNNAHIRVHIDGKNKAAYGLKVTGAGAVVENGRYENFYSSTASARAIDATTTGGITVRNNIIRNVVSVGDNTRGNGPGFSRGVGLNATAAATASSIISGNSIENILGEEGDAIHVLFFDGIANPFNTGKVTVSDNAIRNVSRRFIKVQASDVAVERNKLDFDLVAPPANPSSAIDIIQSENVTVMANEINPNLIGRSVAVNGVSTARLRGIEIRDNVLRQKDTKAAADIYLNWTSSPIVQNNSIHGASVAVLVRSSTNACVSGNTHSRGVAASR